LRQSTKPKKTLSTAFSLFLPAIAAVGFATIPAASPTQALSDAPSPSHARTTHPEVKPMPESWREWNPVADPRAVVIEGHARFTVLTPRLVRLEWAADGRFEDRASLAIVHRALPVPEFTATRSKGGLVIDTGALRLRYRPGPGPFTAENLEVTFERAGDRVTWRPGLTDSLNLKGTTRTLDSTNGAKDVTLESGILSRAGWALVDESRRPLLDAGDPPWVLPRPAGARQDWYLFAHGLDYRAALADFIQVAGRIPMPPRHALGYWWSRYWAYSDDELRDLVAEIRDHGIPLNVLVVDMDWHTTDGLSSKNVRRDDAGEAVGWTGYTWNRDLFPDPEAFLRWAHKQGLRTALNLHPASGVPATEERYEAFARAIGFDTRARRAIPYALEDRRWGESFFSEVLRPLEAQGIDFWWLDWQAHRMNPVVPGLDETYWLNHVFFSMAEKRGAERPLLFHRWGGLGNHRYQIGFSGDSYSTWEALDFQPYFTATASNVGYGWWSHDIGGHQGEDLDPELYLRWLQFGAVSPILRTHSTKNLAIERRIWKYPDEFAAMRDAIRLRYALVPYLYTAAREAYDTGVSVCRPMYYDNPQTAEAYGATGQYMLGNDLIASPVTSKVDGGTGMAQKRTWLPPGDWYEWSSGSLMAGNRWIEGAFTKSEIPIYARAGSVIPLYPPLENLEDVPDTLILACMPGGDGTARIYEDDGTSTAYRGGDCAWTQVELRGGAAAGGKAGASKKPVTKESGHEDPATRTLRIRPRDGGYAGMPARRAYEVRFLSVLLPREVRINGHVCGGGQAEVAESNATAVHEPSAGSWRYDGAALTLRITTPLLPCGEETVVEVDGLPETGGSLDGMPGLLSRLADVMPEVKAEWNRFDPIANPPAPLLHAASAARRLSYDPDRAAEILRDLRETLPAAIESLTTLPEGDPAARIRIAARIAPAGTQVEAPAIKVDGNSTGAVQVRIDATEHSLVTYTLDGTPPGRTSTRYSGPFALGRTARVRARAFRDGCAASFPSEIAFHRTFAARWSAVSGPSPKYEPIDALFDGRFGSNTDFRSGWCGWEGEDMVLTVDLLKPTDLHNVCLRFLRDQRNWIFAPSRIRIEVATDRAGGARGRGAGKTGQPGDPWEIVYESGSREGAEARSESVEVVNFDASFQSRAVTRLRITAENVGAVPSWHRGAGGKAWIFPDEIVAE
jgi:hypothetical protein